MRNRVVGRKIFILTAFAAILVMIMAIDLSSQMSCGDCDESCPDSCNSCEICVSCLKTIDMIDISRFAYDQFVSEQSSPILIKTVNHENELTSGIDHPPRV